MLFFPQFFNQDEVGMDMLLRSRTLGCSWEILRRSVEPQGKLLFVASSVGLSHCALKDITCFFYPLNSL